MSPEVFRFYRTDIPHIDEEHFHIIESMEELVQYCKSRDDRHAGPKAHYLRMVFEDHLAHEEAFMVEIGYKFTGYHLEQHKEMKSKLNQIIREIDAGHYPNWIVDELKTMFINHIDHSDLQYADFVKNNDIKI